ncbi:putative KH and PIN-domain containing protein [uncultured archaeon]|nr:putative KH and PIN-domain containing protein [uncultured archaeon]
MADYMDELFKDIKEKKGQKSDAQQKKAAEKKETPARNAPEANIGGGSLFSQIKSSEPAMPKPEAATKAPEKQAKESTANSNADGQGTIAQTRQAQPESKQQTQTTSAESAAKQQAPEAPIQKPAPQKKAEEPRPQLVEKEIVKEKIEVESYGEVKIYRVPGEPLLYYYTRLISPTSSERSIINTIREVATRLITVAPYKIHDPEQRRNVYFQKILEIISNSPELNIPLSKHKQYAESVVREMVGYGIIDQLIKDDQLEEIMVNGPKNPIFVFHRKHGMMLTNLEFENDSDVQDLINKIARQIGRRVDISSPLLDARMPDGSRVNATIPPASVEGSTLTIRKFREEPYSIIDLILNGTLNTEASAFLWMCAEGIGARPANILISGGTGSGKTTLLNILASFIPESERVISIEDTAELNLPLRHWIRMEARPPGIEGTGELTMDILTKNALRMRPDRIIVGEIRHDEAFTLFTAFNTGHDGSLGTVHANSAQETLVRVTSPPMNVPKVMLSGLNFIIILHRLHDKRLGTIRRVIEIAEVTGVLEDNAKTIVVYKRDAEDDTLKRTGAPISYLKLLEDMTGITKSQLAEEIIRRSDFLAGLVKQRAHRMKDVSEKVKEYLYAKEGS